MRKITVFSILFFLTIYAYGFIVLNESGCTYEGECPEGESATESQIEPLIQSAAEKQRGQVR